MLPLDSPPKTRPPRVLIVTPGFLPRLGGMERQCALLAAEFRRGGFEVTVLTERIYPRLPLRERLDGVDVVRLRNFRGRNVLTYTLVGLQMAAFLVSTRGDFQFAVIRTLTFPALVSGLLKAMGLLKYRTLVTAETGGAADDVIALREYRGWRAFRWLLTHHDHLNSICESNYEHYLELGFDESRLTRIPNGVDVRPFSSRSYPQQVSRFAFLGRVTRDKGVWELLEAFAAVHRQHPYCSLLVAGSGDEEGALREAVTERGLGGAVEFLGRIPHEQLGEFFERSDCLVLPSYSEGLPMAVLEAAAHKRLLVTTDVGDLRTLFGSSIFTCRPRDSDGLSKAMSAALDSANLGLVEYAGILPELAVERIASKMAALLSPAAPAATEGLMSTGPSDPPRASR